MILIQICPFLFPEQLLQLRTWCWDNSRPVSSSLETSTFSGRIVVRLAFAVRLWRLWGLRYILTLTREVKLLRLLLLLLLLLQTRSQDSVILKMMRRILNLTAPKRFSLVFNIFFKSFFLFRIDSNFNILFSFFSVSILISNFIPET